MNDFFKAVRSFLLEYLPNQRCFSENTVRSYRQALNLFVLFLRENQGMAIKKIQFEAINREVILNFLDWLEAERHCCASTRNHRLMVLRSFFDYAGKIDCTQIALSLTVQDVPIKATQGKIVEYLSEPALETLLKQPEPSKRKGLRNLFFMILMYDTAARCGELLCMKVRDLRIRVQHPIAYLHGKGGKTRTVPLLTRTVQHCERYLRTFHPGEASDSEKPLFYTTIHGIQNPMSPDAVALFLKNYGKMACSICAEAPEHIHPHMLRHTRAMHLYHQGMPMMLLSEYLGHASEETTKIYAYLPLIIVTIVAAIPQIIDSVILALIDSIPLLVDAGVQLLVALVQKLPTIIIGVVAAIPPIIAAILDAITSHISNMAQAGEALIKGLWQGISNVKSWIMDKIRGFMSDITSSIRSFFGINSPSTVFADIGRNLGLGIGVGFEDAMNQVSRDMQNAIPTSFDLSPDVRGGFSG